MQLLALVRTDKTWFPQILRKYLNKFIPCTATKFEDYYTIKIADTPLARELATVGWEGQVEHHHVFPTSDFKPLTRATKQNPDAAMHFTVGRRQGSQERQIDFKNVAGPYCHKMYHCIRAAIANKVNAKFIKNARYRCPYVSKEEYDIAYLRRFATFDVCVSSVRFSFSDETLGGRLHEAVRILRYIAQAALDKRFAKKDASKACDSDDAMSTVSMISYGSNQSSQGINRQQPKLLNRDAVMARRKKEQAAVENKKTSAVQSTRGWKTCQAGFLPPLSAPKPKWTGSSKAKQQPRQPKAVARQPKAVESQGNYQWTNTIQKVPSAVDFSYSLGDAVVKKSKRARRKPRKKVQKNAISAEQLFPSKPEETAQPQITTTITDAVSPRLITLPVVQSSLDALEAVEMMNRSRSNTISSDGQASMQARSRASTMSTGSAPAEALPEPAEISREISAYTDKNESDIESEVAAPLSQPKKVHPKVFFSLAEMTVDDLVEFVQRHKSSKIRECAAELKSNDISGDDLAESDDDALEMLAESGLTKVWGKKLLKSLKRSLNACAPTPAQAGQPF